MRSSNVVVSRDANGALRSYLAELRKIAINFQSLSHTTSAKLKKARILISSQRVQRQDPDGSTDHVGGNEKDQDMEYDLLDPSQVAIADDVIAYRQFCRDVFCAPQESILEGECSSACPLYSMSTLGTTDFYRSLSCKRLSDLIQEKRQCKWENPQSKKAQEFWSLILERLPIFLHKYTHASAQVSIAWLNNEENFIVRAFKKITVTRSVNIASSKPSISIEPSATAKWQGKGAIQLWLTDNAQVDMYKVAALLCHLLFNRPKVSDAFLFTMILSTDLCTLWR